MIRARQFFTEWLTGENPSATDLNDTMDYAIGQMGDFTAIANSAMNANIAVEVKSANSLTKGTQVNYSSTGSGLCSISQQINIGTSPFKKLTTAQLNIGIPYDGNTLNYSTYAEVYLADGSKNPTGGVLATSNTVSASGQSNFAVTYTFSSPATLNNDTNYVIVFRGIPKRTGNDTSATLIYQDNTDSNFAKIANSNDNNFDVSLTYHLGWLTINYSSDSLVVEKSMGYNWVGFSKSSVSAGDTVTIKQPFGIVDGFSNLTIGQVYYLSTGGTLQTADSGYKVGVAVSSTKILIIKRTN